jgi:murein DD-endopeptidase MepM/ murein hydrolase activator NlpD
MARRVLLGSALVLLAAVPAGAGNIVHQKQSVDARIAALNHKVAQAHEREKALQSEVDSTSAQILSLEQQVGDVSIRLGALQKELSLRELRLHRLDSLYQIQTERYRFLRREYRVAVARLDARIVAIYETAEPDDIGILFLANNVADLLDGFDYVGRIGDEDNRIVSSVSRTKRQVKRARAETRVLRRRARQEARVVAVRVSQARALRDQLVAGKQQLEGQRAQKRQSLASLSEQERQEVGEMEARTQESAQLAAQIRAAQARSSSADTTPSAGGLIWPVNGPVTSPFGMRWGRMHEGIDIGASYGTPIRAAAGGRVIIAGWVSGYGNVVYIDHGGGLSTGYAHQSRMAVSVGQEVSQGQVIGYVGCTGHCFGPHLHFEVRVNGVAVDPLGYL